MDKKKMKKISKIVLIVVFIFFMLFMINTIRKLIIIKELQRNVSQYTSSTNYYVKYSSNQDDGAIVVFNSYQKDNKRLFVVERIENGKTIAKISTYDDGKEKHTFLEASETKKASLDSHVLMAMNLYDCFGGQSNMQLICSCISSKVESVEHNGKECYRIGNFRSGNWLDAAYGTSEVYIEKDTGLVLKTNYGTTINTEMEYQFDTIQDEIFVEPDISQYELVNDL